MLLSPRALGSCHTQQEVANSDAAAAVIVEREEQHRENVGVKGAIVLCDEEGNTRA